MYLDYRDEKDFIGMDMCRKFLEMGFTRARRYANHNSGRKYKKGTRDILPQESDHATSKICSIRNNIQESTRYCGEERYIC